MANPNATPKPKTPAELSCTDWLGCPFCGSIPEPLRPVGNEGEYTCCLMCDFKVPTEIWKHRTGETAKRPALPPHDMPIMRAYESITMAIHCWATKQPVYEHVWDCKKHLWSYIRQKCGWAS